MSSGNEHNTLREMIRLYCRQLHGGADLCPECRELWTYAEKRLAACRYGDAKPQCKNCPVHCYSPTMRKRITAVMRYSGPRMLFRHPLMAVRHLANRKRPGMPGSHGGFAPPPEAD